MCWLCEGDVKQPVSCSSVLSFSGQTIAVFANKLGVVGSPGEVFRETSEVEVVCDACLRLVTKIDVCNYELEACMRELESRVTNGEKFRYILMSLCLESWAMDRKIKIQIISS